MTLIYARLTRQGVAASETAVCGEHFSQSEASVDLANPEESTVTEPVDCSGNETLECQVCGARAGDDA